MRATSKDCPIYSNTHLNEPIHGPGKYNINTNKGVFPALKGIYLFLNLNVLTRQQIDEKEDRGKSNADHKLKESNERIARRIPMLMQSVWENPHSYVMKIHGFFCTYSDTKDVHSMEEGMDMKNVSHAIYQDYDYTLPEYINGGRSVENVTLLKWAYQLISAILHLHETVEVMHRKVNPEAVYVFKGDEGKTTVKLGDILFARKPSKVEMTADRNHPFAYAAPETLNPCAEHPRSAVSYGLPADIWSYGMVLFYITHQKDPYPKEVTRKPIYQLREYLMNEANRPQLDDGVDEVLKEIIRECWKSASAERLTAAQIKAKLEKQLFPTVIESNH